MRINRFEIVAFGPFTDRVLDFSARKFGLHVIYGANEAGKSSALRALKAWLFGFPERTRDDFLHPRKQLLVGGELATGKATLTFYRRKKRKGDIVDVKGNPLDLSLITPFLAGLDLGLFESLYGIDHDTLVRGGREILAQKGNIGETLFSAGTGMSSLHRILEDMESEKDSLFRVKAQKPKINKGIKFHNQLKKEIREQTLAPSEWQQYADELEQASRKLDEMQRQRLELDRRYRHLERLHRAAPLIGRRQKVLEQEQALGPHRPLPPDFSNRRSELQQELHSHGQRLDQARARKKLVQQELEKLSPRFSLLTKAPRIEEGVQRLGEYSKARKDRPRLEGMRTVHHKEVTRLLRHISPNLDLEQVQLLLPLVQRKKKILSLVFRYETLKKSAKDGDIRLAAARRRLRATEKKLAAVNKPGDWSRLVTTVTGARKAGEIDKRIQDLVLECETRENRLRLRIRQVGHWQGTDAEFRQLDLPPAATIHMFADERQDLEQEISLLVSAEKEIQDNIIKLQTRRRELGHGGKIPSEEELQEVRRQRDRGWQLICRNWLAREDVAAEAAEFSPDAPLHETFFSLILQADTVGDRLRLEADRVHAFAALQAGIEELGIRLERNRKNRQEYQVGLRHHQESWQVLWNSLNIAPAAPKEMAEWRARVEQLQEQAVELQTRRKTLMKHEEERNKWRRQLSDLLAGYNIEPVEGAELEPVLLTAETLLARLQDEEQRFIQTTRDREQAMQMVSQFECERDTVQGELEKWRSDWQQLARIPGNQDPFEPGTAQDLLDGIERIFSGLKEVAELESRMRGIDRDCLEFENDVKQLARETAAELAGLPAGECVLQLQALLSAAGKEQALYEKYEKELKNEDRQIRESELALASHRKQLEKLMDIAGCHTEEELILAEQNDGEHRRLARQLQEVEQDLQQVAGKLSFDELATEVEAVDYDSLPGELHSLKRQISEELDPAIQTLAERKGEARKMLEQMDGSERAACKAEELQENLARLRQDAEQYLRLQVGVDLLRNEIERFRRKNQGPVLTIASHIFAELTLGSFSGLKTDVGDRGEPVLVGIRRDSQVPIGVEAMSTGSRDQLYLALRLATLQHRVASDQAMPHIFDDILINFDDARGAATLKVLARLGQFSQLILFTHHQQVAGQAEDLDGVQLHVLE